jgi:hypothetical protein
LVNASNKFATKRLTNTLKPSIILLRGTMMDEEKVIQELSKFMTRWVFSYIDAIGRSGGK